MPAFVHDGAGLAASDRNALTRQVTGDAKPFGRRELNKLDKLKRISSAAREHFASKGYEGATLRDIAREAGVALGTVGLYAETKQDLVLLIFNQEMSALVDAIAGSITYEGSLVDALTNFFRPIYQAFADDRALYRVLLRENVFSGTSPHAVEQLRHRTQLIDGLVGLMRQAEAAGEVRSSLDMALAGRTAFFILFAAVRWWIAESNSDVEQGLRELRQMLGLLVDGMGREPAQELCRAQLPHAEPDHGRGRRRGRRNVEHERAERALHRQR